MAKLSERLQEVMDAKGWTHADLVRISQQSSSVVSQWLGKGSKEIKSIGKLGAALRLSEASGYSAVWIAEGVGPRMATAFSATPLLTSVAREPPPAWRTHSDVLSDLRQLLHDVPIEARSAFADLLAGWAKCGGDDDREPILLALLRTRTAERDAA
jgi:transcriptional regulator with XRE-family HTH domain